METKSTNGRKIRFSESSIANAILKIFYFPGQVDIRVYSKYNSDLHNAIKNFLAANLWYIAIFQVLVTISNFTGLLT